MSERKVRMGIDVGGTHTKAVAIDNATHEIQFVFVNNSNFSDVAVTL